MGFAKCGVFVKLYACTRNCPLIFSVTVKFLKSDKSMFELPGLDGVEQVVIGPEVVEGKARPLYIYAERAERAS